VCLVDLLSKVWKQQSPTVATFMIVRTKEEIVAANYSDKSVSYIVVNLLFLPFIPQVQELLHVTCIVGQELVDAKDYKNAHTW
jgi:hypothetical protein